MLKQMLFKERGNIALKILDRMIGIPVLLFLSLFKIFKKKIQPLQISERCNIALLKSAAIGDTVILSAVVEDIRQSNNNVRITLFTGASNYDIALLIPGLDQVIRLPVTHPLKAALLLRQCGQFDVLIDFGAWPRLDALFSWAARAAFTTGFKTRGQFRHYLYDRTVDHSNNLHEIDNYRNLVSSSLHLKCSKLPQLKVPDTVGNLENPRAVLHLFPGGSKAILKQWAEHKWVQLISVLADNSMDVFLTGGNAENDKLTLIKIKAGGSSRINVVAGHLSIFETAKLLKTASFVVSVDTGVMHMASALNCNVIALHGPTCPHRWGPLNSNSFPIFKNFSCSPCISLGFESKCKANRCMDAISVDDVINVIIQIQKQKVAC